MDFFNKSYNSTVIIGRYYYRSNLDDMLLKPLPDSANKWIEMDPNNRITGYISITSCNAGRLTGVWKSPDGKITYPIHAKHSDSYSRKRLSSVNPQVIKTATIGNNKIEIIGIPSIPDVTSIKLLGDGIGIKALNNEFLKTYLTEFAGYFDCYKEGKDKNLEYDFDARVVAWNDKFIVVVFSSGGYCGDAPHPYHGEAAGIYDIETGQREKMEDWFAELYREKIHAESPLGKLLSGIYKKHRSEGAGSVESDDADLCLEVISFSSMSTKPTEKGLSFFPFAPYANTGCAEETVIPYKEVWPYLSDEGKLKVRSFMGKGI